MPLQTSHHFCRSVAVSLQSVSNEYYLSALPGGALLFSAPSVGPSEQFRLLEYELVPKFMGVNLGGWLVPEAWMCPAELFDGVFDVRCLVSPSSKQ